MKNIGLMVASITMIFSFLALPSTVSAEDVFQVCQSKEAQNSPICRDQKEQSSKNINPLFGQNGLITNIVNIISIIAGIAAVIIIIIAGLRMITGGNNPQDVQSARNMVIFAVVGLVVIAISQALVRWFIYNL